MKNKILRIIRNKLRLKINAKLIRSVYLAGVRTALIEIKYENYKKVENKLSKEVSLNDPVFRNYCEYCRCE